jgi:RND family efflux transporter MFP subunit
MPGMGMPSLFDQFFTKNMGSAMGYGSPNLERHADLYSRGTQISQAQSRVLKARSRLEEVDAKLRDTRSIAPFAGVIVKKLVEVGDTVQPGTPLLHYSDTTYLQMRVEVPARLMPGLRKGMIVSARLDVGNKHVQARVAQIFPMADVQRHTVTVKFDLPKGVPGGPGMYAEVNIPDFNANSQARQTILIPVTAVQRRGSLPGVYVLNKENKAELKLVRLGEPVGANQVTVISGLQTGDRVLANPPANITSGWSPFGNKANR